ncbi:MAG: tetratricopeptide repeat protein [Armatimonadetes bacterium]|nr:tetratricopeptide repeat protein [Armatimonadota bacterium]
MPKKSLKILLILFFFLTLKVFSQEENELAKNTFINNILKTNETKWEEIIKKNKNLLDYKLLKIFEERALYAVNKEDYSQAYKLVYLADLIASKIKIKDNYRLGLAFFYFKIKNYNESLNICKNLLEEKSKNPLLYIVSGLNYYDLKNFEKAKIEFQKAVELEYKNPEAHYYLGLNYLAQNEINKAKSEFQKTLEIFPDYLQAKEQLAKISANSIGASSQNLNPDSNSLNKSEDSFLKGKEYYQNDDIEKALLEFEKYLASYPKHALSLYYSGRIYIRKNDYEKAKEFLEKSKEIDPKSSQNQYYLGYVYEYFYNLNSKLEYLEKSISSYKEAALLDPQYVIALEDLKRVEEKKAKHLTKSQETK